MDDLAHLQAFPSRWLEAALGLISVEGMNELLLIVEFDLEIKGIDVLISELTLSHPLNELQVRPRQLHVPVVSVVSDFLPPVLVVLSLNKLL